MDIYENADYEDYYDNKYATFNSFTSSDNILNNYDSNDDTFASSTDIKSGKNEIDVNFLEYNGYNNGVKLGGWWLIFWNF